MQPFENLGLTGKKWEIFESSVYLFAERGYENVSIRELAAHNQLRAASLYNYFPSKESLLELMHEFYVANYSVFGPDLAEILALAPESTPLEILRKCTSYYHPDLQSLMDSIFIVSLTQANRDERAFELIWNHLFVNVRNYISHTLQTLMDIGKIEPMDIEAFTNIYSSFSFTAIFLNRTPKAFGLDAWQRGLDMIFSLVKAQPESSASEAEAG